MCAPDRGLTFSPPGEYTITRRYFGTTTGPHGYVTEDLVSYRNPEGDVLTDPIEVWRVHAERDEVIRVRIALTDRSTITSGRQRPRTA